MDIFKYVYATLVINIHICGLCDTHMQRTFYLKNQEQYDIWVNSAKLENQSISAFLNACVLEHIEKKKKQRGITTVADLFGK